MIVTRVFGPIARAGLRAPGLRALGLRVVAVAAIAFAAAPAAAQSNRELAARLERIEQALAQLQTQAPAEGSVEVRVLKLEDLIAQLTGQVEEAQFRLNQATTQLKTLQDDLQYRVAVLEQGADAAAPGAAPGGVPQQLPPRSDAPAASATALLTPAPVSAVPASAAPPSVRAGDEPLSQPMTPAPRITPPSAAGAAPDGGPLDGTNLDGGFVIRTDATGNPLPPDPNAPASTPVAAAPPPAPAPEAAPRPGAVSAGQLAMAPPVGEVALPDGPSKAQYDFAFDLLRRNDFGRAEVAFREFLKRHPKDALAGNAQYWLGETYYVRGDYQQAAVEFMAGYQNYPKTNKGPDNLLKLGMAMSNMGQTQGACTALNRLAKDYPKAPPEVTKPAAAERAKLKCK